MYFLEACDRGTKEKPCLHCKFIQEKDPTGRKFADKHVGGWHHFQRLLKFKAFKEKHKEWMEELAEINKSEAIARVQELMLSEKEAISLASAKYIAEQGWEKKPTSTRGRPSKTQVEAEIKNQARKESAVDRDFERIANSNVLKMKPNTKKKDDS